MIKVTYKGVDVTTSISINRCIHDMYAAGQADTLDIRFNDAAKLWDGWAPAVGDEIRVDYGPASTGTMFVRACAPENGLFTIKAMSAPPSAMEIKNKAWSQVRLLQIGQEVASRNGLSFQSYNVTDQIFPYLLQAKSDLAFLHRVAVREGCGFLIYDKALILYGAAAMEAVAPVEGLTIPPDGDYRYLDARAKLYGSCVVEHGDFSGKFEAGNGVARVLRPVCSDMTIGSNAEAERYAKNLLRDANKDGLTGYVRTAGVAVGYAAASTAKLVNQRAPSWNGPVFLHHVRHDYALGESKLFFRKPLEGY